MRGISGALSLSLLLLVVGAARAGDDIKQLEAEGFVHLFDGKTLSGWKANENPESWTALPDGTIHGKGPRSHLFSPKEYTDFEFRAEVMTKPHANSGMYFRAAFGEGWPKGYEAQVNNSHGDPVRTGSLYNFVPIRKKLVADDVWFTQHIICTGNHIIIKVNGDTVVDFIDEKNTYTRGHLALQEHDPGSEVFYRNLMVKDRSK